MSVFKSSYKHFKESFFKLEAGPSFSTLLLDEHGRERFPLYWTRKPRKGRLIDEPDLSASVRADIERGFGLVMAAIKTCGIWSSFMAYLVVNSFRRSVEEYGRCEEEMNRAQKRVTALKADVQKYETNKSMLEGKCGRLSRDFKEAQNKLKASHERIRALENDLEAAQSKLKEAQEDLKKAEAAIVSEPERI